MGLSMEPNRIQLGTVMKIIIFCMFTGMLTHKAFVEDRMKAKCECWEDFYPEVRAYDEIHCRGRKHNRIFPCDSEKPPICQCLVDGHIVELDLGEMSCLVLDAGHGCHNAEEMEAYFAENPKIKKY